MKEWLPQRTQIILVELFAAVLALDQLLPEDNMKSSSLFVDSEPAESALIKGYSARSDICDVVASRDHSVFVTQVPSDGNPADGPSRAVFKDLEARGALWQTSGPPPWNPLRGSVWRKSVDERIARIEADVRRCMEVH